MLSLLLLVVVVGEEDTYWRCAEGRIASSSLVAADVSEPLSERGGGGGGAALVGRKGEEGRPCVRGGEGTHGGRRSSDESLITGKALEAEQESTSSKGSMSTSFCTKLESARGANFVASVLCSHTSILGVKAQEICYGRNVVH